MLVLVLALLPFMSLMETRLYFSVKVDFMQTQTIDKSCYNVPAKQFFFFFCVHVLIWVLLFPL